MNILYFPFAANKCSVPFTFSSFLRGTEHNKKKKSQTELGTSIGSVLPAADLSPLRTSHALFCVWKQPSLLVEAVSLNASVSSKDNAQ